MIYEEETIMKKIITKVFAAVMAVAMGIGIFSTQAYAYSAIPDYFDFGDCVVSIDAGSYKDVWVRATYDYTYYVGPHTSSKTYIECSQKSGSQYVRLHIGPDETQKNVEFFFYVNDKKVDRNDLYDSIEVYVQNIDPEYAKKQDMAAPLKWYANNNSEFNAYDYYMNYPDLQAAYGTDANGLFNHYYTNGKAEHRVANRLV